MRKKNKTIDLSPYKPQQHPLRDRFRGRVSFPTLANYLGVSTPRVAQIMNGTTGMPTKHEQKLEQLADALDQGRVKV